MEVEQGGVQEGRDALEQLEDSQDCNDIYKDYTRAEKNNGNIWDTIYTAIIERGKLLHRGGDNSHANAIARSLYGTLHLKVKRKN